MSEKVLEHRGFKGTTEVSLEDGVIFGKVLDIDALIMYSAETVTQLRTAFIEAVDDYLADCEREGVEPQKPYSGTFNVRVGSDMHRKAACAARNRGIKLNEFVKQAIAKGVDDSDPEVRMSALWAHIASKMSKIDSWNEREMPQADTYLPDLGAPTIRPIIGEGLLAKPH